MEGDIFSRPLSKESSLHTFLPYTGAKEECREEAEEELRRSWGERLPRGATLLALLELSEICSGHYKTFAFAFQLKRGNWLNRTSNKPASSQLESAFFCSYLADINYCSTPLAAQQPSEKKQALLYQVWQEQPESATSQFHYFVASSERRIKRKDPAKDLNI